MAQRSLNPRSLVMAHMWSCRALSPFVVSSFACLPSGDPTSNVRSLHAPAVPGSRLSYSSDVYDLRAPDGSKSTLSIYLADPGEPTSAFLIHCYTMADCCVRLAVTMRYICLPGAHNAGFMPIYAPPRVYLTHLWRRIEGGAAL